MDRGWLHHRIQERFDKMLNDGLLDEVLRLKEDRSIPADAMALRLVGYRQILSYLWKEIDYDTMREAALAATRQLSKRQMTWMRKWSEMFQVLVPNDRLVDCVSDRIKRYLNQEGGSHVKRPIITRPFS
jgi:tRNA dimethylallyltransferase